MDSKKLRLDSVDLLRGLVMVFMALDHVRYPYFTSLPFSPENMEHTYLGLFLTRWITHFCAPLFFLLAGTGAYLSVSRGRTISTVSGFLWKRGLWLVILELTLIAFAWSFMPSWRFGGVIWSLGWSMIIMSFFVRLPVKWVAGVGVGIIVLHNLLDHVSPAAFGRFWWLWVILYSGGPIKIGTLNATFPILYSIIPWVGVMAAGFALGLILEWEPPRKRQWLLIIGGLSIIAYVVLRATNVYGDPSPFRPQATWEKSFILFLNVTKYPASLQFLLMTLGPSLVLLSWFDRVDVRSNWLARKIVVFGRVPMFFYIFHLFLIHLLAILVGVAWGQPVRWLFGSPLPLVHPATPGYGHGLPFIFLITSLVIVLLYFPCKWFAELKQRRGDWWLRYV